MREDERQVGVECWRNDWNYYRKNEKEERRKEDKRDKANGREGRMLENYKGRKEVKKEEQNIIAT